MPYNMRKNTFDGALKKVIDKFAKLNEEYETYAEDAAHWYNEGTSTSLLSVAAWQCGRPALCETGSVKRVYTGGRGRPRNSNGRGDLFLYDENDVELWVEAKKTSSSFDASSNSVYPLSVSVLTLWMDRAWASSEQNRAAAKENNGALCSLLFLSFRLNKSYYEANESEESRRERMNAINSTIDAFARENDCVSASFFDSTHVEIEDGYGFRPVGFAIIGYVEDA